MLRKMNIGVAVAAITLLWFASTPKYLHADDSTAPCVLGGVGTLCYTIQEQTCTLLANPSGSIGTSTSIGSSCLQWTTTMKYYYRDNGGTTPPPKALK